MFYFMLAETRIETAKEEISGFVKFLIDNPFGVALTLIFLVALVGAFAAARKRDRCLKKLRDYPVTVRDQAGRSIWGQLKVFSKGLELMYAQSTENTKKQSILLYEPELTSLLAIYRFLDRLEGDVAARRNRQVRLLIQLRPAARLWRGIRNVLNTFRDAFVQVMGATLTQAAKTTPNPLLTAGQAPLTSLGTTIVGELGLAYEPILEQYIGSPVVLEFTNPADAEKRVNELRGYLAEYSEKYVLLVNVRHAFHDEAPLSAGGTQLLEGRLLLRIVEERLVIENRSAIAVTVEGITVSAETVTMSTPVPPLQTVEVPLPPQARAGGAKAILAYERELDLIVPRTCGFVRFAVEDEG
jgi:small nuclear ribonucleoprotein (snRNP)-like protein